MEELLTPYLRCTEKDSHPGTPAFSLTLQGPKNLSRTAPYLFHVALQRVDESSEHCLFSWTPQTHGFVASGGFLLLHHTAQGQLKPVKLPECNKLPALELWRSFPLNEHGAGSVQQYYDILPDRLLHYLQTGERYVLFWPGQRYTSWRWEENPGENIYGYIPPQKSEIVLPGGPFLSFTVVDNNGEKPIAPTPISGVEESCPVLIARIECHPQDQVALQDERVTATLHVTYEPISGGGGRPITFNTAGLRTRLWVWRDRWVDMEGFSCSGGNTFCDDPDIQVSPGRHEGFACLHPGETWSHTVRYELLTDIESTDGGEAKVGEVIRCLFMGTQLDWWVWGTREDHLATTATIPATGSWTVREPGNDPVVIVPAAAPVDLEIV